MAFNNPQALYNVLAELQVIPKEKLDEVFTQSKAENIPFEHLLTQKDLISDENLGKTIAELLSCRYISLTSVPIPDSAQYLLPESYVKKHNIMVFSDEPSGLKVATTDPHNETLIKFIQQKAGKPVSVYYTTEREINRALRIYKKNLQEKIDTLIIADAHQKDVPITEIVDLLINYAYNTGASDIHIEPEKETSVIRFRVDGVLQPVVQVSPAIHKQILSRIKVLAKLRTDEHFSAQDGKLQISLENELLDIRISVVPLAHGEKCVMRLLASHLRQFSLTDLGMSDVDLEKVKSGFTRPHGMVLSTGPTGSGKSTSMYAILKILNTPEKNIATIEDPVEYDILGVNQIQVNSATNLTFAEGLRSILRQDPDIIYVGEIRDNETADIAINSALTGHLVLSTLHTNDSATTLPRLIDMDIEPFLIASTINVIIAQRLVRKICVRCKVSYNQKTEDLNSFFTKELIKKRLQTRKELSLFKGKGCDVCQHTGYLGRIGIFEILVMSDPIRELVTKKATSEDIMKLGIKEGMTTMMEDGFEKILQGITTVEEVVRTTRE